MKKKALFITSCPKLKQMCHLLMSYNNDDSLECLNASSLSESIQILEGLQDFALIFVGHKVHIDDNMKTLATKLIPLINETDVKIYGTNKAFKNKSFAHYYNELTPVTKIFLDLNEDLDIKPPNSEGYIGVPLMSLLEFSDYPFDCFFKVRKNDRPTYLHVFRESDDVDIDDIYKYKERGAKVIYASTESINKKVSVLENALKSEMGEQLAKNPEKAFELSAQYALDILAQSGLKLPSGLIERNREAFANVQEVIKDFQTKSGFKDLMSKSMDFYYKHVSMTTLICCYILEELMLSEDTNRQKLTSAAYFQNIFLKNEQELKVFDEEQIDRFEPQDQERIIRHPLMAYELLSQNPLIDSDVLKIIREHHGDKRGFSFPETMNSSSKMSAIFQIASLFSLRFLIEYERTSQVDVMKIFNMISAKMLSKDQSILMALRNVAISVT